MNFEETPVFTDQLDALQEFDGKNSHADKTNHFWRITQPTHDQPDSADRSLHFFAPNSPYSFPLEQQKQPIVNEPLKSRAVQRHGIFHGIDLLKQSDQDDISFDGASNKKRARGGNRGSGLRGTALTAFELIRSLKETNYKQLCNIMIQQLAKQSDSESAKRVISNIKRRIYDILNLFRTIGLIRKTKKTIIFALDNPDPCLASTQVQSRKRNLVKERLLKKEQEVQRKQQIVRSLLQKRERINSIFNRNQQSSQSCQKYHFPLIATIPGDSYSLQRQEEIMLLSSSARMPLYGDVDMLMQLNMSEIKQETIKQDFYKQE